MPLLGFYYWCTNQSIVQRMLSAKNTDHARWGALFAGLLKLTVLFLIVLPGTCALLLFPHLPRADLVYPNLILHLLPVGLAGLVVGEASVKLSGSSRATVGVRKGLKYELSSGSGLDYSGDPPILTGSKSGGATIRPRACSSGRGYGTSSRISRHRRRSW